MNTIIMQIPIKPLSVNAKFDLHYKARKIIKSSACKRFESLVEGYLLKYKSKINNFKNNYSRDKYALQLDIIMYVPEAEFFTKEGLISATCIDAGNALKMLEDIIYKYMGINDGFNTKVSSEKRPYLASEWLTHITISEIPLPKSCYLDNSVLDIKA